MDDINKEMLERLDDEYHAGYHAGFKKGVISKTIQKCPHCNKLVDLRKEYVKNES